jgi:two-component system, response regulator
MSEAAPMDRRVDILLAEDNPDDVKLALHAFRRNNLANSVQVVADGADALDFIFCREAYAGRSFDDPPKMLLLDLKMPRVDGLEVLREVRSDPRTRLIPVVMMTASSEERDRVESYALGVNSYIVKPLDFDQFVEAMRLIGMYWLLLNQPPKG